MDDQRAGSIEISPLQSQGSLYGFIVSGRWPQDMIEWSKILILAVQLAAVPGLVPTTTVYRVREDKPDLTPSAVGLVVAEGSLIGDDALQPGQFARDEQPPGLFVLHPPAQTIATVRDHEVASGCVYLPGLPYLGLDHRAAWVEADIEGTVTHLVSRGDLDPNTDADTAALAMLLAA
jgi:hypothetical protein